MIEKDIEILKNLEEKALERIEKILYDVELDLNFEALQRFSEEFGIPLEVARFKINSIFEDEDE